jgi:hypothetical protein
MLSNLVVRLSARNPQVKKADLAAALAEQAGSTRRRAEPPPPLPGGGQAADVAGALRPYRQPGRQGLVPITAHFPKDVRRQLKGLAFELDRTMHDLVAEALNDLFAKHNKPELCRRGD